MRNVMDDFYRENIIDHYKNPLHKGIIEDGDYQFQDENPLCGDLIQISLRIGENGKVEDAVFDGQGCAISIASADLLCGFSVGKDIEEIKQLSKQDVLDLLGIELSPVRLKCALLPLKVIKAAIYGLEAADDSLVE